MARNPALHAFYNSDQWQWLRAAIIVERGLICGHCKGRVAKASELTLHHVIELTPENVGDAMISLNPDNLVLVHHGCHNKIHLRGRRNGSRDVIVVYGAPLSGKKTFVRENLEQGDLVLDMDALYVSMSMQGWYNKPDGLFPIVRGVYNQALDYVKTRYGRWDTAWIIGGYPERYRREQVVAELSAEAVLIEATRDECIDRLDRDPDRSARKTEWTKYIDRWFDDYTATVVPPGPA